MVFTQSDDDPASAYALNFYFQPMQVFNLGILSLRVRVLRRILCTEPLNRLQLINEHGIESLADRYSSVCRRSRAHEHAEVLNAQPHHPGRGCAQRTGPQTPLVEMNVQGVSIRKVAAIVRKLCGTSVSSTQVSRFAALSEMQVHWNTFFTSLRIRNLQGVKLVVSDDQARLGAVRKAFFPSVLWQRCRFHLQQNVQGYVRRPAQRLESGYGAGPWFDAMD